MDPSFLVDVVQRVEPIVSHPEFMVRIHALLICGSPNIFVVNIQKSTSLQISKDGGKVRGAIYDTKDIYSMYRVVHALLVLTHYAG